MALSQGSKSSLPVILFLLIGFAAPLIAVVWFSFMPPRSFSFAGAPTLENYQTIFDGTNYISFLWSLVLAVIT
ncbi:MAG: ABC transporter permease, partial [Alphaproteobacteria bacterium]|nr:ABC transporter permease [Alphaproteobacteria bacterium]